ncbi:tRNA uridine-5-carboxymethylaminomethyl(34) synthesis GTPase MnmE [bacterium]|nr:MAG: tRNA uridine-5-carboxymethylaminomethyl(34) synthesis GTPase MnmE [bacterium]
MDTIAAIATPPGRGAISMVRVSGPHALQIGERVFEGRKRIRDFPPGTFHHGFILDPDTGRKLDEVVVLVYHAPHSFTGEDMLEITTHGGLIPARRVLRALIKAGARMAEPGEFTRRAMLNGKMDLIQAESLLDLIDAKTEACADVALKNLTGELSERIKKIREKLLEVSMELELSLDFTDQDLIFPSHEKIKKTLEELSQEIKEMIERWNRGRMLMEGMRIVITGKPNVGKSTLFNALLSEEKAIVTEEPGTTRDVLEGWIEIEGFPVKVFDTAGLRPAEGKVEKIGIERAKRVLESADLVLFVVDGSQELSQEDMEIYEEIKEKQHLIIINKCDLGCRIKEFPGGLRISALTHEGMDRLHEEIKKLLNPEELGDILITHERHYNALRTALQYIEEAEKGVEEGRGEELIAEDVKFARETLSSLVGEITSEEILDEIFSNFCIGK